MAVLTELKTGRYALLQAWIHGDLVNLGVLLEDPALDAVHVRLRRDWEQLSPGDPSLPLLEADLAQKAGEWGARRFFDWAEARVWSNLHTTEREAVAVADFDRTLDRLYARHVNTTVRPETHVPVLSLRSAAGKFRENPEIEPEGHVELPASIRMKPGMFAGWIAGTSMEPEIPDGSLALFQSEVTGSRQGRLVLVEEAGSRYTLKRYRSRKNRTGGDSWQHEQIVLEPLNREHEPIVLSGEEDRYRVVAWFVAVLY